MADCGFISDCRVDAVPANHLFDLDDYPSVMICRARSLRDVPGSDQLLFVACGEEI